MTAFVLVPGAWRGSWLWQRVRRALQADGHEVFTPTLTGVADRLHLATPAVDLETHIADVLNLVRFENLDDFVLCGHSYAGCVVTGVADRIPEKLRALFYLDAFVLEDGQSLHSAVPPELADMQVQAAKEFGECTPGTI
jgi:pimeloyl-ACP methyl ester carboxylesterase